MMMGIRFIDNAALLITGLMMLACCAASAQTEHPISQEIDQLIKNHPSFRRTTIALKIVDLSNGEVIYDRGGDRLLTPASNLKIFTTAIALDTFRPDHKFMTEVRGGGGLVAGVLHGDFILLGDDPMLTSEQLLKMVDSAIEVWDLREIRGKVDVANHRYASSFKGPGWMWDDDPAYYNMSITPIMVDFNVAELVVENGKASFDPPSAYPPVAVRRSEEWSADRRPFEHEVTVQVPRGSESRKEFKLTPHDPGQWVEGMILAHLQSKGIEVKPADPKSTRPSSVVNFSPTVAEIVKHLNHESENAVGEALLHEIAIAAGKEKPTWKDGAAVIKKWLLETAKLEEGSFRIVDGSGLSRYNLITPDASIRLLRFMNEHDHSEAFYGALKKYDVDGRPAVAAKSGGMSGVSTISGYVDTRSGRRLAFSLMTNGFIGSNRPIVQLRESIWAVLACSP